MRTDLGVDSVGGQQHGGLWWTVDLLLQDLLLHLRSNKMLYLLNTFIVKSKGNFPCF